MCFAKPYFVMFYHLETKPGYIQRKIDIQKKSLDEKRKGTLQLIVLNEHPVVIKTDLFLKNEFSYNTYLNIK